MNVLFLTITGLDSIQQSGLYTDLLRRFVSEKHNLYVVSARQKREGLPTEVFVEGNARLLKVKIGNITKSNLIEKGFATINIKRQYISAINQNFSGIIFDLILYATPPVTLAGVVRRFKNNGTKTYLMLKDIFPQNAVDLGMLSKKGIKGLIYRYFRKQEKMLYSVSDHIGCMSPAGISYLLKHDPEIAPQKIGLCPNSRELSDKRINVAQKAKIRNTYGIPQDKTVFVCGGNFGKGHDIDFIIKCLKSQNGDQKNYFLFFGSGTDYGKFEEYFRENLQPNVRLMKFLPVQEYETVVSACDVGLIFLGWKVTTPEFPSRLLPYLRSGLPVLAAVSPATDIGRIIEEKDAGYWCCSNDVKAFSEKVYLLGDQGRRARMGEKAFELFCEKYEVGQTYNAIMKAVQEGKGCLKGKHS